MTLDSDRTVIKDDGPSKPKLTLNQKRDIVFEWFVDPERSNINKFCVEEKKLPQARPFVRKAAMQLSLFGLRKMRKDKPEVDAVVKNRIMGFTPNNQLKNNAAKKAASVETNGNGSMKDLLVDFFHDESMTPLVKFLRMKGALQEKDTVLQHVKTIRLRKLRMERDEPGVQEKAMLLIDQLFGDNNSTQPVNNKDSSPDNKPRLTLEQKKTLVLAWFTDPEVADIDAFCLVVNKNVPQLRSFIRRAANQLDLRPLRKMRKDKADEVDKIAKERIMGFTPSNQKNIINATPISNAVNGDVMKKLLVDFFNDESMTPLVPFLRKKGILKEKDIVLDLMKKIHLRKLRKERDDPGVRHAAMSKIDELFAVEKTPDLYTKNKQQNVIDPEQMKPLLIEWFEDPDMSSIAAFTKKKELFKGRIVMRQLVKAVGLSKLRKDRENLGVREKAIEKIDSFLANKENLDIIDTKVKRCRLNNQMGRVLASPTVMKTLIQEWYIDENMLSIPAFLVSKGKVRMKSLMVHLVNESKGLRKLRMNRETPGIREKAMKEIDRVIAKELDDAAVVKFQKRGGGVVIQERDEPIKKVKIDHAFVGEGAGDLKAQDRDRSMEASEQGTMKALILEWFASDALITIPEFLKQKDKLDLILAMSELVDKLALFDLKKQQIQLCCDAAKRVDAAFEKQQVVIVETAVPMEMKDVDEQGFVSVGAAAKRDGTKDKDKTCDDFVVV